MTEPAPRVLWATTIAVGIVLVAVLSGCVRSIDGAAFWTGGSSASASRTRGRTAPAPGIETTIPSHIPPNAFVCFPGPAEGGVGTVAHVVDAAAPRLTLTVPDGWSSEPGHEDVALTLTGPDEMTGLVTIAATKLDPARAFSDYAATQAHSKPDYQVQTLGAPFCGFSGQKLVGTFRGRAGTVEFADRLTHIWTNTGQYLVAIHLEGPEDAPGFLAAKAALMQDFAVDIP